MDSDRNLFDRASYACVTTWPKTIYSYFHMYAIIVQCCGKSWEEMVAMRRLDKQTMENVQKQINDATEEDLLPLWVEGHGLCTSCAILIASKISDDPNTLLFGDDGRHRVAFTGWNSY